MSNRRQATDLAYQRTWSVDQRAARRPTCAIKPSAIPKVAQSFVYRDKPHVQGRQSRKKSVIRAIVMEGSAVVRRSIDFGAIRRVCQALARIRARTTPDTGFNWQENHNRQKHHQVVDPTAYLNGQWLECWTRLRCRLSYKQRFLLLYLDFALEESRGASLASVVSVSFCCLNIIKTCSFIWCDRTGNIFIHNFFLVVHKKSLDNQSDVQITVSQFGLVCPSLHRPLRRRSIRLWLVTGQVAASSPST